MTPSKSGSQYELIWKNSNTGQFVSWKLDASGALIKGDLLSQLDLNVAELELRNDLNGDARIGPLEEKGGTAASDILTGAPLKVTYGFTGDDQLTSGSPNAIGFDILIGGIGNDRYVLPAGKNALIADLGGDSNDSLTATGLTLTGGTTQVATLDKGRHLAAYDFQSNTTLYVYDWQKQSNKIETIQLADGTYSFAAITQAVLSASPIDYSWQQWDQLYSNGQISKSGLASTTLLDAMATSYAEVNTRGFV